MDNISDKCYGSFGWRQFWQNRLDILAEYDRIKSLNLNRPVRTSHGDGFEAKIRSWLSDFLPQRYGVTSGFIIPNVVVGDYILRHFDIIIYNQLDSPVLWAESDENTSVTGKKRAIPAEFVQCVLEVKATFNKRHVDDSVAKLRELNLLKDFLPKNFRCASIFAELTDDVANNLLILKSAAEYSKVLGYWGSVILRNNSDVNASGEITLRATDDADKYFPEAPLKKSIDELNIYLNQDGNLIIAEDFGGVSFCTPDKKVFCATKQYSPTIVKDGIRVTLSWSHNSFNAFVIQILYVLEGKSIEGIKMTFAQIYDKIERKSIPIQPSNLSERHV